MKAQPKKFPGFPSIEQVRERVTVKPKAVSAATERRGAEKANAAYTKWLGALASDAIKHTSAQRKAAQSVTSAKAPVVLHIPPSERGLVVTAYLFSKGQSPSAAFCGALASAISERLEKLGSNDFVGVELDTTGASVTVRISDREIPKTVAPQPAKAKKAVSTGDTDFGAVSMTATAHCAVIEACVTAVELGLEPEQVKRAFGREANVVTGFFAGEVRLERKAAFNLVETALVVVRESQTLKRPRTVNNGDINKAIAALQSGQRTQSM